MTLPRFLRRVRAFFRKEKVDAEMSDEMRHHLEMQEQENLTRGMTPEDARYAAQRSFGGVEQMKERVREQRSWIWLEDLRHDVRYTGRSFARNPGFTVVIVSTLAFAIGAGTAAFTTAQEFFLTSPPIREPETLVRLSRPGTQGYTYSYPFYEELREGAAAIAGVIATSSSTRTMSLGAFGQSIPEGVLSAEVSGNYFSLLGIQAVLGRAISPEDDRAASPAPVVVLSHTLWRDRFAADRDVVGRTIILDGVEFSVAGVAPESFKGVEPGRAPQLWLPLSMMLRLDGAPVAARFKEARAGWLRLTARLAPQTSASEARARFEAIYQRHLTDRGVDFASKSAQRGPQGLDGRMELVPKGGFNQVGPGGKFAVILMSTVVGLVLMVACTNVASLLLTRAMTRQREFALRSALGAGNARLVRQLLTESLSLSLLGGLFGVLLSNWGIQAFIHRFAPPGALDGIVFDFKLNPGVLLFSIGTACGVGVIVGLAPTWHFRRIDLISRLKQQEGTMTALSRQRLQRFLVVAQIAVSICLLVGAGLMNRTLQNLRAIDLGFVREKVLQVQVILDKSTEPSLRPVRARELLAGASSLPGVISATLGENTFGLGRTYSRINQVEGYVAGRNEDMSARPVYVGPAFFEQWGIPILQGRGLTEAEVFPGDVGETQAGGRAAVVSETFARKYFASANPIGRTFRMDPRLSPLEVVGVARDVMFEGLPNKSPYVVYMPFSFTMGSACYLLQVVTCNRLTPFQGSRTAKEAILSGKYGLIVVNYANPDMVGHTGSLPAAIKAVEATDQGVGELLAALASVGGRAVIFADHGNCEQMWDFATDGPHTSHTLNPVEIFVVGEGYAAGKTKLREGGRLADVAPTVLQLMGLKQPKEMTGRSLIVG